MLTIKQSAKRSITNTSIGKKTTIDLDILTEQDNVAHFHKTT